MKRLVWASLLAASAVLPACSPWDYGKGDFFGGSVDGTYYPSSYTGGTTEKAYGTLSALTAQVGDGSVVTTYYLPMPDQQANQGSPAAAILGGTLPEFALATDAAVSADLDDGNGQTFLFATVPPAQAFSFDATATEPYPTTAKCVAPKNYVFDGRVEAYRLDYQGPIFTAIPQTSESVGGDDPPFVPYWAEVAVTSNGEPCQQLKDADRAIADKKQVNVPITKADPASPGSVDTPTSSGKFLAWFPIDPRTDVQPDDPVTGWGAQKWGWYKHLLFAYIDGGYAPTQMYSFDIDTTNPLTFTGFRTQKWYYPAQRPFAIADPDHEGKFIFYKEALSKCDPTNLDTTTIDYCYTPYTPGDTGAHASLAAFVLDFMDGARGQDAYSPICELCPFPTTSDDWDALVKDQDNPNPLPLQAEIANAMCSGTYAYCPQQLAGN